ncbi:hypothetical protein ABT299_51010 [Spirillospora sp. NPDC000708]
MARLEYTIAASTVWEILHAAGIDPAPRRAGSTWRQFMTAQARAIIACDFLVVETVLLKRVYVLVFFEYGTHGLHLGGVTAHPTGAWAVRQARSLATDLGERVDTLRFLLHDRDPLFTTAFAGVFKADGLRIITTLLRTPRMNAICERVIGTLRRELLDRILILGERHLAPGAQRVSGSLQPPPAAPVAAAAPTGHRNETDPDTPGPVDLRRIAENASSKA